MVIVFIVSVKYGNNRMTGSWERMMVIKNQKDWQETKLINMA